MTYFRSLAHMLAWFAVSLLGALLYGCAQKVGL